MVDSDPDSDSWLVATIPGDPDSGSDSDSAPLDTWKYTYASPTGVWVYADLL